MYYCKKCGGENADDATTCYYCGCTLGKEEPQDNDRGYVIVNSPKPSTQSGNATGNAKPKTTGLTGQEEKEIRTIGILLSFFLSLIGLIIGICIYPPESRKRRAFLDGWVKGFIIDVVLGIIAGIIGGIVIGIMLLVAA